jgi:hypothetical protein
VTGTRARGVSAALLRARLGRATPAALTTERLATTDMTTTDMRMDDNRRPLLAAFDWTRPEPSVPAVGGRCSSHLPPTLGFTRDEPIGLPVRPESSPAYQGALPGAGLRTTVAVVLAVVLVHPEPLVLILAFVTLSVFEPL